MYLIKDRRLGMDSVIFIVHDPRNDGYKGEVMEGVRLDYDMEAIHIWPPGQSHPAPQLGRDPADAKHFRVFKSPDELRATGYELVHENAPLVVASWAEYCKMFPLPTELAEKMSQDEWYDYLEEVDAATRRRRQRDANPDPQPGSSRDQIAEWVAKRHLTADGSIREVRYLPAGAPADEIRLLEVNDRYSGENGNVEPIDFGLDVSGAKLKLLIADITATQMKKLEADSSQLPKGWKLADSKMWGRR